MSETLAEKRSRAGKLGAAARWHPDGTDGTSDGKPRLRTARPVARLRQGRNDWYRIENKTAPVAEVMIYDEIGYFGVTAQDFVNELRTITSPTIRLGLNSPGGDAFDAVAIFNALRDHPARVEVSIDGLAASAVSFIAMAGDAITAKRNATMMIHDAQGLSVGNAADMRDMAELLDKVSNNIADIYAQRAGGTVAGWRTAMRATTWYTATEAQAAGLVDSVDGADGQAENSWDLSIYSYAGREQALEPVIPEPPAVDDFDVTGIAEAMKGAFSYA